MVEKIGASLIKWELLDPTTDGCCLITQMILGGLTQYHTMAQGIPTTIEKSLKPVIQHYIWDSKAQSLPRSDDIMFLDFAKGGRKILDIQARNEATALMKLRRLVNFSRTCPLRADVTRALSLCCIPKAGSYRWEARADMFLLTESERRSYANNASVPKVLQAVLAAYVKYNVSFNALQYPIQHLTNLPAWHSIGQDERPGLLINENNRESKRLRKNHRVRTVSDLMRVVNDGENEDHEGA